MVVREILMKSGKPIYGENMQVTMETSENLGKNTLIVNIYTKPKNVMKLTDIFTLNMSNKEIYTDKIFNKKEFLDLI